MLKLVLFAALAVAVTTLPHAATYNPPHIPVQTVPPTPEFDIPWWLGSFIATVNETSNWTLPLTYPNGGRTPIGTSLIIQNQGPSNITLYATAPETIQGLGFYIVQADSTVLFLSNLDWIVTSTTSGSDASSGVFTNLKVTNYTELNGDVVTSGPLLINSDNSSCSAGFVAGTSRDTCLYRASSGVWTFNSGGALLVPAYSCTGCNISAVPSANLTGDQSILGRISIGPDTGTFTAPGSSFAVTQLRAVYSESFTTSRTARAWGQSASFTSSGTITATRLRANDRYLAIDGQPSWSGSSAYTDRVTLTFGGNGTYACSYASGGSFAPHVANIDFQLTSPGALTGTSCVLSASIAAISGVGTASVQHVTGYYSSPVTIAGLAAAVTDLSGFYSASSTKAAITRHANYWADPHTSTAPSKAAYYVNSNTADCSAGFVAGTTMDTCFYRAAANSWTFNAGTSLRVPQYICSGCTSAPTNTAAGAISTTISNPTLQAFGAVTANAASGTLAFTVSTAALTCGTATVTNTNVAASSEVILTIQSYSGTRYTNGIPVISRANTAGSSSGSFIIQLCNDHATNALSGNLYVAFWVLN